MIYLLSKRVIYWRKKTINGKKSVANLSSKLYWNDTGFLLSIVLFTHTNMNMPVFPRKRRRRPPRKRRSGKWPRKRPTVPIPPSISKLTPTRRHTARVTMCRTERWLGVTISAVWLSGITLRVSVSVQSPRASGIAQTVGATSPMWKSQTNKAEHSSPSSHHHLLQRRRHHQHWLRSRCFTKQADITTWCIDNLGDSSYFIPSGLDCLI